MTDLDKTQDYGKGEFDSSGATVEIRKRSLAATVQDILRTTWQPSVIPLPAIDPNLDKLPTLERVAEVCRYQLLQLEYSLSRGGGIREWLRLNLIVAVLLSIPALLVVPVVTWLLGSFVTMTAFVYQAAQNLFWTVLTIIATISVALVFVYVLRALWRAHLESIRRGSRRRK